MWIWWAGAALALAAVEVVSTDLVFLMLAGGALAGSGAAALGAPVWGQFAVFALVAIALMLLARPPLKAYLLASTPNKLTNVDALAGREATVLQRVSETGGLVQLDGGQWSARSVDKLSFAEGASVRVVRIDGAVAVVGPLVAASAH